VEQNLFRDQCASEIAAAKCLNPTCCLFAIGGAPISVSMGLCGCVGAVAETEAFLYHEGWTTRWREALNPNCQHLERCDAPRSTANSPVTGCVALGAEGPAEVVTKTGFDNRCREMGTQTEAMCYVSEGRAAQARLLPTGQRCTTRVPAKRS